MGFVRTNLRGGSPSVTSVGDTIFTIKTDTDNNSTTATADLIFDNNNGTTVGRVRWDETSTTLNFGYGANNHMSILTGGNVGIGTTTAIGSSTLSVLDASGNAQIAFGYSGSGYTRFFGDASNNCYIQPGGATAMTLLSGGNVGIGTASPATALQVGSTSGAAKEIAIDALNANAVQFQLRSAGTTDFALYRPAGSTDFRIWSGTLGDVVTVKKATGNVGIGTTTAPGLLTVGNGGGSDLGNVNFQLGGAQANSRACIIRKNTSTPYGTTFLFAGHPTADAGHLAFSSSDQAAGERMRITSAGLVGIGTSAPATILHTKTASNNYLTLESASGSSCGISGNDGAIRGYVLWDTLDALRFYSGGGSGGDLKMSILTSGNVGIGTSTPATRLDLGTGGKLTTDRTTEDAAYINFKATADADATSAISTLTTSGATTHHIQIEINGVTAWIAASTTDPS